MEDFEKTLKKLTPLTTGPHVLVSDELARVQPIGRAGKMSWWIKSGKDKSLKAVENFYQNSVQQMVICTLQACFNIANAQDPTKELKAMTQLLTGREEETAIATTLNATILYVIGGGPEPDLTWIAAEKWEKNGLVEAVNLFAAESVSIIPAGSSSSPFTVNDTEVGAIADCLNVLFLEGGLPHWQGRARAQVESTELSDMLPIDLPKFGAPSSAKSKSL